MSLSIPSKFLPARPALGTKERFLSGTTAFNTNLCSMLYAPRDGKKTQAKNRNCFRPTSTAEVVPYKPLNHSILFRKNEALVVAALQGRDLVRRWPFTAKPPSTEMGSGSRCKHQQVGRVLNTPTRTASHVQSFASVAHPNDVQRATNTW